MAKDKRIKGCPNEECANHIKKTRFKADQEVCPDCGAELVFVCRKCFCEIQDINEKHRVCRHCMEKSIQKKEEQKEAVKGVAKKVAAGAGVAVVGVGGKILNKVLQDTEKDIVKKGVKVIEAAAKKVIK